MAIILEFPAVHHSKTRPRLVNPRPAEIVIFPGVRYESWDEEPRGAASGDRNGSIRAD